MVNSVRHILIAAILMVTMVSPVVFTGNEVEGYSNPYLFTEAVDITYSTDLRSGLTLDSGNIRDVYRIRDLKADEDNYISEDHLLTVGVIKDDGANILAKFYEPNGRPIGTMYSEGVRSEIEFYVPYDGDYFLEVMTDPEGSSSEYSFQLGGEENTNNEGYDNSNTPGATGFSGGDRGGSLHHSEDIVDYFQVDIPPFHSMESVLVTATEFKLDILNITEDLIAETEPDEKYQITNDGGESLRLHFRVYFPLEGNKLYPPTKPSYNLIVDIWSHTTIPEINIDDPWPNTIVIDEDTNLSPRINLSTHFIESMGDVLDFSITSENENIDVMIMNYTIGKGELAWNYSLLHIHPHKNWAGEEVVSLKAKDRDGEVTDSFTLSVTEINDLPRITQVGEAIYRGGVFNIFGLEDLIKVYKVNYTDEDDPFDNLYFDTNASAETMPFIKVHPNGTIVVSPDQSHVGKYNFNISLNDGRNGQFILDIFVDIQAVNDIPDIPLIEIVKGNMTLLPGEEISLLAKNVNDIDGDDLTVTWYWGDGKTSTGNPVFHTYSTSYSGNTTVRLVVDDGFLSSEANITIYVEAPEDIAVGDLRADIVDPSGDAVENQEEWRLNNPDEKVFTVSTVGTVGLDILSIRTQRKGSVLQVFLDIKGTIQIDGSFHYHLFILKKGYSEPFIDFRNISDWDSIPDRMPDDQMIVTQRKYVGDLFLHNESTGTIMNKATLVWNIPFNELVEGGLDYPIDPEEYQLFAVSSHKVEYAESGNLAQRYIITDTAGMGARIVDKITPLENSTGDSSSTFGDFAKPTNILVVIVIVIVLIIFGVSGFVLVQRQMKQKKEQEKEFIDHVNKLREEGKDPFGNELDEEEGGKKETSYESLYGTEKPEGYVESSGETPASTLPGPGLGTSVHQESHIEEMELKK